MSTFDKQKVNNIEGEDDILTIFTVHVHVHVYMYIIDKLHVHVYWRLQYSLSMISFLFMNIVFHICTSSNAVL